MRIPAPRKISHPKYSFVVHLPLSITAGKQCRKFFKTEKVAREYCQGLKREIEQHGMTFLTGLNEQERFQVQQYIIDLQKKQKQPAKTVEQVCSEFYQFHQKLESSLGYLAEIRHQTGKIKAAFGIRDISTIEPHQILDWVTSIPLAATSRFDAFKIIRTVFSFAVSRTYLSTNPCQGLSKRIERPRASKSIFTPEQLKQLLTCNNPYWRIFVCLRAFAGLRSCEVWRGNWSDLKWESKEIFVRPESAKQVQGARTEGRIITLNETLTTWLKPLAKTSDKFIDVSFTTMRRIQKKALELAGLNDMPQNALRHSFATYHYALYSNAPLTAKEMGHTTMKITFGSYARCGISKVDGQAWFGITPDQIKKRQSLNKKSSA